jgi:Uma2 family endonuclease
MLNNQEIPKYSYNDYKNWEGYWELINGYPYAMSPSAKNRHQVVGSHLITCFYMALKKNNKEQCPCQILYETDWIISQDTVVRPDIAVVCGTIDPDDFIRIPPVLIVEIASESTRLKDRNTKFILYEQCGVNYYLLADPEKKQLEYYQLVNNKYEQQTPTTQFKLHHTCTIEAKLDDIFEW